MSTLFVSKISKQATAKAAEEFLSSLFPEATHIQLLLAAQSNSHKGHAYIHFINSTAAAAALERVQESTNNIILHEMPIKIRVASRVDSNSISQQLQQEKEKKEKIHLPPQLAHFSYTSVLCFSTSTDISKINSNEITASCKISDGRTVIAFATEEKAKLIAATLSENVTKCLPPLLPELLTTNYTQGQLKREKRERDSDSESNTSSSTNNNNNNNNNNNRTHKGVNSGDIISEYERRGFVSLSPAQTLSYLQDLMEGRGRIAVRDSQGNVSVLNLPAHVSALE